MKLSNAKWRYGRLILLLCLGCQGIAMANATVEYKVKAGYLYNFTQFVTWIEDNSSSFNVCIVGQDPFGHSIDPIEKKTAFGRPIKLFKLNDLKSKQLCHIRYTNTLPTAESNANQNTLVARDSTNTLTVGEDKTFIDQGGMIRFVNREGKIKLQINLHTLKQSGLKISAKLLEVAEVIEDGHD